MPVRMLNAANAPQSTVVRIETPQREVVETVADDIRVLHVVEPVLVTTDGLNLTFGSLVDTTGAEPGVPLALVRDTGGAWRTTPISIEDADLLTEQDLGRPGRVAQLGADGVLMPAQRPPDPPQSYTHVQSAPSTVWVIVHGLDFNPAAIQVVDHVGAQHYPQITYPHPQTVQLRFRRDVRGTAWLS